MSDYTHRTIVVPAAFVAMARALAAASGPGGSGNGMFQSMLSPTAQEPATHYISTGHVWRQFAEILPLHDGQVWDAEQSALPPAQRAPISARPVDSPGHPEQIVALALKAQMPVTLAQVQALFRACKVSTYDWQETVTHLGLQPVVSL